MHININSNVKDKWSLLMLKLILYENKFNYY